ncbi:hypothetical protein M271_23900 [Streptomyces rapamycinicus NRRL 5491]|nr:hypothetical protein M271_23900 [Streptomyces rapamycinicus NRRL 5491]
MVRVALAFVGHRQTPAATLRDPERVSQRLDQAVGEVAELSGSRFSVAEQ